MKCPICHNEAQQQEFLSGFICRTFGKKPGLVHWGIDQERSMEYVNFGIIGDFIQADFNYKDKTTEIFVYLEQRRFTINKIIFDIKKLAPKQMENKIRTLINFK